MLKFTPEDFMHEKFETLSPLAREAVYAQCEFSAIKANAKLEQWLKDAPVVYGLLDRGVWEGIQRRGVPRPHDTHRAQLVNIEKIDSGAAPK